MTNTKSHQYALECLKNKSTREWTLSIDKQRWKESLPMTLLAAYAINQIESAFLDNINADSLGDDD